MEFLLSLCSIYKWKKKQRPIYRYCNYSKKKVKRNYKLQREAGIFLILIENKEGIRDFIAGMLELVMVIMERRKIGRIFEIDKWKEASTCKGINMVGQGENEQWMISKTCLGFVYEKTLLMRVAPTCSAAVNSCFFLDRLNPLNNHPLPPPRLSQNINKRKKGKRGKFPSIFESEDNLRVFIFIFIFLFNIFLIIGRCCNWCATRDFILCLNLLPRAQIWNYVETLVRLVILLIQKREKSIPYQTLTSCSSSELFWLLDWGTCYWCVQGFG